ncbi:MAG: cytidine deaminase [Deltaproteobacteria bacterium]|nr:MAG: cytidine deaminase [Deltaproteobacteria bacterium]
MRGNRKDRFETALNGFPDSARTFLQHLPQQGGKLSQKMCNELMSLLDVSIEALMIRLLPLAKVFSVAPISEFHVGAVALAAKGTSDTQINLYLGANMEFKSLALSMTLHSEQVAVMNAWHREIGFLKAISTSEPPCGHCRQFLNELFAGTELMVLWPVGEGNAYHRNRLSEILPEAFTPSDLGNDKCLMAPYPSTRKLRLVGCQSDDLTVLAALSAAEASYAPYTENLAGCAVRTPEGEVVSGSYVESVAYNPSVSPLLSVILRLNLMSLKEKHAIDRIVLVEKPTRIRQMDIVEMLIRSWAPGIELEYHIAEEEE